MESERIAGLILDIGVAMIRSGAETHRVEDSLYRLCKGYGFSHCNIWVVPTNIQATITAPDGSVVTQIRHVRDITVDFTKLDRLNSLCRAVCANPLEANELETRFKEADAQQKEPLWRVALAAGIGAMGYGVFFRCDLSDTLLALLAALLIVLLSRLLSRSERNPLALNFIISFITEVFIISFVRLGLGHHADYVTLGVVMLLISALGTTNGVRDLVHLDTLSGTMNITLSMTGAIGIALGIALAITLLPGWSNGAANGVNSNVWIQLASCTIGCVGFALWFCVRISHVAACALGGFITWGAYIIASLRLSGAFAPAVVAAIACGAFSQIAARAHKAPATIFMTVSIFPLIPGAALYSMMVAIVLGNSALAAQKGAELALTCFAIVLGFMVVEVLSRYIWNTKSIAAQK